MLVHFQTSARYRTKNIMRYIWIIELGQLPNAMWGMRQLHSPCHFYVSRKSKLKNKPNPACSSAKLINICDICLHEVLKYNLKTLRAVNKLNDGDILDLLAQRLVQKLVLINSSQKFVNSFFFFSWKLSNKSCNYDSL